MTSLQAHGYHIFMRFPLILALLWLHSCQSPAPRSALENAPKHLNAPYVILVSIDGYRHDYTAKYRPPHLSRFTKKGIQAEGLQSIFPSKTFPNHYTLVTGLNSESHGIVANSFWDPKRQALYKLGSPTTRDGSWYSGEPLWVAATKQEMLSASYFWVGSDANIQGIHPTYWYAYSNRVPNHERVEQVLRWLEYPASKRPHLITLYFSDVDRAGHQSGPDSSTVRNAVFRIDKHIGRLMEGVEEIRKKHKMPINIIIVSDHGMQKIDSDKVVYLTDYLTLSPEIRVEGRGSLLFLYIDNPKLREEVHRKLTLPAAKAHFHVFKRGEFPPEYGYNSSERIGDLVISARPTRYIYLNRPLIAGLPKAGGTHGYDPYQYKSMQGIFYARGPQIRNAGLIPAIKNIHVYPFIMNILGLEIATKIDGKAEVLAPYHNKSL